MTKERVLVAMEKYRKEIPSYQDDKIKRLLENADDDCMDELMFLPLKSKIKTLMFSIFLGGIGVDRFYLGDTGLGVFKIVLRFVSMLTSQVPVLGLLLSLGSSIWNIVDIFLTYKKAKVINFDRLSYFLSNHHKKKETPQVAVETKVSE